MIAIRAHIGTLYFGGLVLGVCGTEAIIQISTIQPFTVRVPMSDVELFAGHPA